jgi:hypothetical protein
MIEETCLYEESLRARSKSASLLAGFLDSVVALSR